jgi:hypothetical protein
VAVEKLLPAKFAKMKSRQDALQTTSSVFLDIFYPQILAILRTFSTAPVVIKSNLYVWLRTALGYIPGEYLFAFACSQATIERETPRWRGITVAWQHNVGTFTFDYGHLAMVRSSAYNHASAIPPLCSCRADSWAVGVQTRIRYLGGLVAGAAQGDSIGRVAIPHLFRQGSHR